MPFNQHSTDHELRQGCLDGHRTAQRLLYQRYFGQLLGIPMRYTRDREEATSLMNQAFLQIFKSLEHYQESGSFKGWMSTITFRATMDHLRYEQRYRERYTLEASLPNTQASYNTAEHQLATADIFRHIQQLPDHQRIVFSLFVIDGYRHDEIAAQLGITVSNSKWRLAKARQALQRSLGPLYNAKGKSA